MSPFVAYDAMVALAGTGRLAAVIQELRRAFAARTGAFAPEDPWFEVRSRAFWDHALTREGLALELAPELEPAGRIWGARFVRAHRGLFSIERGARPTLRDAWTGAAFTVTLLDDPSEIALSRGAGEGLVDARLVADADARVAMLPGALFHPAEATAAILDVLREASSAGASTHAVLDALLLMEHRLRSLSRVRAGYAYRWSSAR